MGDSWRCLQASVALTSVQPTPHTLCPQPYTPRPPPLHPLQASVALHSVQRPPYSIGMFSQAEAGRVLSWMLGSYYRQYKLYQYCFTDRWLGWLVG